MAQQTRGDIELTTNKDLNGVMTAYTALVVAFLATIVTLLVWGGSTINDRISDTNQNITNLTQEVRSMNTEQNRRMDMLVDIIYNVSERVAIVEVKVE